MAQMALVNFVYVALFFKFILKTSILYSISPITKYNIIQRAVRTIT